MTRPHVKKPRGVPERPSEKKRARRARILAMLPSTQLRIHKRTKISQATISRWLADLVECEEAHIGGWQRSPTGGPFAAVYHPGPGEEAPCRLQPLSVKELSRRYYKRKKDEAAQHLRDIEKSRAWIADFIPQRDPLTAALFGPALCQDQTQAAQLC